MVFSGFSVPQDSAPVQQHVARDLRPGFLMVGTGRAATPRPCTCHDSTAESVAKPKIVPNIHIYTYTRIYMYTPIHKYKYTDAYVNISLYMSK